MKTYPVEINGKLLTLSGLTDDVKTTVLDIVIADLDRGNNRRMRNKVITEDEFVLKHQSINATTFTSEAVILFIGTPEGGRAMLRAMVLESITDADLDALNEARLVEGSPVSAALAQIFADSYPKKKTEPEISTARTSTRTRTSGKRS
jgi:hypothetical protein